VRRYQVRPIFLQILACMIASIIHHAVSAWFFHYELDDPANNYYRSRWANPNGRCWNAADRCRPMPGGAHAHRFR